MSDEPTATAGLRSFSSQGMDDALQVHMQALLQEQAELLDETYKVMAAWTKRRAAGVEANFRASQGINDFADLAGMSAPSSAWLINSMNRIFASMNDVRDEALRLAQRQRGSVTPETKILT